MATTKQTKNSKTKPVTKAVTFEGMLLDKFDHMLEILKEISVKLNATNELLDEVNINVDNIDDNVSVLDDNISNIDYRLSNVSVVTKPQTTNKTDTKKATSKISSKKNKN